MTFFDKLRTSVAFLFLLIFPGALLPIAASADTIDPTLTLTAVRVGPSLVVNWAGANAVPYQVESSTDLAAWTSSGPVLTGNGSVLSVTNSIAGPNSRYYRVKRLFPAAPDSATFDPGTGLLTIVGDDLDNMITVGNDGTGRIIVNGGAWAILGGVPTVTNTVLIQVLALGGNDQVTISGNLPPAHLFGDAGNDTLIGGSAAELFVGGPGNDIIDGNQGSDVVFMGDGDDTFQWDPGDGNDTVEGQAGNDRLIFNGSNIAEIIDLSANGSRLRLTRNVANIVMDVNGVERADLNLVGGADIVTVNNLARTGVVEVNANLANLLGGNTGDIQADNVIVNASNADDSVGVVSSLTGVTVTGLAALVNISTPEAALDRLTINGLAGNDTLQATGLASGVIGLTLNGGPGNDTLTGSAGADMLIGDEDNDTILGGSGDDLVQLGNGNDRFIWNPGDGSDVIEGSTNGVHTVEVNGGNGAEQFTVTANGTRVRFDRLNPAPFFLDIGTCQNLVVNANGGDDSFSCTGNLAALIQITADGGPGNDTLLGGNGADVLIGGDDNDFIDGNQGNDVVFMGNGDDTFQWDPGDGNDTVEGQAGNDRLIFNGSNIAEIIDLSANGSRLRLTRNVANIVLDVNGVERADLNLLGGADIVTVNDLAGTGVVEVNANLASMLGGNAGDASADNVIVNASNGDDAVGVASSLAGVTVTGLAALVNISTPEAALDRLTINGLAGNDTLQATGLAPGVIGLTLNGGPGNDTLTGSAGADMLIGDEDNDTILGGSGDDLVQLGNGNDRFIWNPGDGSDVIEGSTNGVHTVEVNGGNGAEQFTVTANGTRVRFDRLNPAPFFLDIGTCQNLVVNANGGDDSFSCTGNLAALIQITADGGPGNDTLLGGNGADVLIGGDDNDFIDGNQGNDVVFLGVGDDTFQWDPGDGNDTVEGQAGNDRLIFNGSNIAEIIDLSANGSRLRLTRNVANIVMDVNGVERADLNLLGGADIITVNDLTGTGVSQVNLELAGTLGGSTGDAASDIVTVNGTGSADTISVTANAGAVSVSGLAALVQILHPEAALDSLVVNGLAGTDLFSLGAGVTALIGVTLNQ